MMRMTARVGTLASALLLAGTIAACNKKGDTTVTDTTSLGTTTATVAVDTALRRASVTRTVERAGCLGRVTFAMAPP